MLHNQIWISLSRYRTAKGNNRIVDRAIEFEQVDRERNWDDQILFTGILYYLVNLTMKGASNLPLWRSDGVVITTLLHVGPVEFIYYWLHRALHHHYLYSRYHSHHHSSIVTEPITSVVHPFAEHISYFMLFAIPLMTVVLTGTGSIVLFFTYITFVDLMNNMGHCNFELIPGKLFSIFPPLKYIMYTPSELELICLNQSKSCILLSMGKMKPMMQQVKNIFCMESSMDANKVKGKVVHCKLLSSGIDYVVKGLGGIGTIIQSDKFLDFAMIFMAPSTMVNSTIGKIINKYIRSTKTPSGVIYRYEETTIPAPFIASFSARGPIQGAKHLLKLDIAAPGIDILAAYTPWEMPTCSFF